MLKYLLGIISIYLILLILALIFIIISYKKSPVHLDIYSKYNKLIDREYVDEKFDKFIYIDFIDNYLHYKNFYKKNSTLIYVFSGFNLLICIFNFIYIYKKKKRNKKINPFIIWIWYIHFIFTIIIFVTISDFVNSHFYMKLFVMDLMEKDESEEFIKFNKKAKKYETISYYMFAFYFIFLIIEYILLFYILKNYKSKSYGKNLKGERIKVCKKETYMPSDNSQTQICAICQNIITKDTNILILPCKHFFHYDCIEKWFEKHNTCPIDRTEVLK